MTTKLDPGRVKTDHAYHRRDHWGGCIVTAQPIVEHCDTWLLADEVATLRDRERRVRRLNDQGSLRGVVECDDLDAALDDPGVE